MPDVAELAQELHRLRDLRGRDATHEPFSDPFGIVASRFRAQNLEHGGVIPLSVKAQVLLIERSRERFCLERDEAMKGRFALACSVVPVAVEIELRLLEKRRQRARFQLDQLLKDEFP